MFRYSICDPANPKILEMGEIDPSRIMELYARFPWEELWKKMEEGHDYWSPSLEIENLENKNGLTFSLFDWTDRGKVFYLFYKRPKQASSLFGLIKRHKDNYLTDTMYQSEQDALDALTALIHNDLDTLERRWGK